MLADPEKLRELALRCEQASGPDRELDGEIDRLLHKRPKDGDYDEGERAFWRVKDGWSGILIRYDGFARDSFCARTYTASLDAAMTLVLERCTAELTIATPPAPSYARVWRMTRSTGYCRGSAPALALTAAALRARAALSEDQAR